MNATLARPRHIALSTPPTSSEEEEKLQEAPPPYEAKKPVVAPVTKVDAEREELREAANKAMESTIQLLKQRNASQ